jgi:hypothetical protein
MPEIEDFLSSLEDDEDQEQQQKPEVDPRKLGYALRQEQKQKKQMAKELEELRALAQEFKTKEAKSALSAAGLNDFHSDVYMKFYPEVSEENISAYKARAGLETAQVEEAEAVPERTESAGFAPTSVPASATLGSKIYTQDEFEQLLATDPARAMQIHKAGRVQLEKAPGGSIFVGRDR